MRIVHTADWHVGRVWKNVNRLDEMAAVLEHLAEFIERERIGLLLMAGDVFETGNPPAEAERLVFRFFKRIGQAGVQSVVIAGNHDSAARLDAWGTLAELVDVRTLGRPQPASKGGVQKIGTSGGEQAVVAAVPFAAPRYFVSAMELAGEETAIKTQYAEMFKRMVGHLCDSFQADSVNLLMAHTHLDSAVYGESERRVHLGDDWAATPQALPSSAHYVALGHIHKPQKIEAAPAPTWYAGSPLQLDFGEVGQQKVFLVIDAVPGRPARVQEVPYEGGKPLLDLRLTLDEIEARKDELRGTAWMRLTVPLAEPDPDLSRKVRSLLPAALVVHAELPERSNDVSEVTLRPDAPPTELYAMYHRQQHGGAPDAAVLQAFERLYEQHAGET